MLENQKLDMRLRASDEDAIEEATEVAANGVQIVASNRTVLIPEAEDIGDKYELISILGEGGMATVHKARDKETGKLVALKLLKDQFVNDSSIVERFYREARSSQHILHRNIVPIYGCGAMANGSGNKLPFLVMELIEAPTLAELIAKEGALRVDRAVKLFEQVCDALSEAHKIGMVHRDIKPSNILIAVDETGSDRAMLADFGIAKPRTYDQYMNPRLTHTGSILGSPAYMSPEQCMGEGVDERSDIYSMGCLMYETLTGRNPFADDTPVKTIVRHLEEDPEPFEIEFKQLKIPKAIEGVVFKCLAKKPANRFQKAWILKDALTSFPPPKMRRIFAEFVDFALVCFVANYSSPYAVFLLAPLYFASFESSKLRATPVKLLFDVKVSDRNGNRLNFLQALTCSTIVCNIYWGAMFLTALLAFGAFSWPGHATAALAIPLVVGLWIAIIDALPGWFNNELRHVHDLVFGRVVTRPFVLMDQVSRRPVGVQKVIAAVLAMAVCPAFLYLSSQSLADLFSKGNVLGLVPVVVASDSLRGGTVINESMVGVMYTLPVLLRANTMVDPGVLIGKTLAHDVAQFDAITDRDLELDPQVLNRVLKGAKYARIEFMMDPRTFTENGMTYEAQRKSSSKISPEGKTMDRELEK